MRRRRHRVDQADLQGNVLCGYGHRFTCGRYLLVTIKRPEPGRRFLGELAEQVTTAVPWGDRPKPMHTLNVAVSYAGLCALEVPEAIRKTFPEEFRDGMKKRAWLLGDTGRSAPGNWEPKLRQVEDHHLLLTVMARDPSVLAERLRRLERRIRGDGGLAVAYRQDVRLFGHAHDDIPVSREHFGFADGFSQPAIRGNAGPHTKKGMGTRRMFRRWSGLAPGEFVLGYPGEDKLLPEAPVDPLARNGSYTVFRKLYQDVYAFDRYIEEHLDLPGLSGDANAKREQLAAKIVGRWMDGRSLVKSSVPTTTEAMAARNRRHQRWVAWLVRRLRGEGAAETRLYRRFVERVNKFDYAADPDGFGCPLGAHVRRANPRDALGWQGRLTKRHRIVRRGMPYGAPPRGREPLSHAPKDVKTYNGDRGLVFICHQASIKRQFEVIQSRWLNDGDAFWLGDEKDFLAGGGRPAEAAAAVVEPDIPAAVEQAQAVDGAAHGRGRFERGPTLPAEPVPAPEAEGAAVVLAEQPGIPGPEARAEPEAAPSPGRMTIQGAPPRFLEPEPRFAQLRGGGYFFTPGLAALRALARPFWL